MAGDIVILQAWVCKVQNILKIIVVYPYGAWNGKGRFQGLLIL
jgi:hypothetical protein